MKNKEFDWLYVFDADEFAIKSQNFSISDYLSKVSPEILSVRYEIENWVSNHDFQIESLESFENISYVSIPNLELGSDIEHLKYKIIEGEINFFELPSISKIFFRNGAKNYLGAGAHNLEGSDSSFEINIDSNLFSVAHLPFLTRERINLRAQHGRNLILAGFPESHGWHEKIFSELDDKGGLDNFWIRHSMDVGKDELAIQSPAVLKSSRFSIAIQPTVISMKLNDARTINFDETVNQKYDISDLFKYHKYLSDFAPNRESVLNHLKCKILEPFRNLKDKFSRFI